MPIVEVPGQGNVEFPDSMSDEAIATAIKKNSSASYPTPKLPPALQGPPPGGLKQVIQNIPGSLAHAITNPYAAGMPQGNPQFNDGEYHGPTPESVGNEFKGLIPHPIDDPVGTALQIATLGKYRKPIAKTALGATTGAVKAATEMIPMRHYGVPMDVPAPIAGAAAGGFAGWLSHLPYGREVGAALGAASPLVRGAVSGVRDAFDKGPEMAGPPPIGKPASRFDPSQYNSPQAVKPPVETGGAHIPDYQGPTIQPPITPERTPIWKSAQDAADHNEHLPEVTQGDEFKPPVVQPPVSAMPAGGGPNIQSSAEPIIPQNKPIIPDSKLNVSGGETPSGPEIIKPGTAPPGEELIPQAENLLTEQARKHAELVELFERFKKQHPQK